MRKDRCRALRFAGGKMSEVGQATPLEFELREARTSCSHGVYGRCLQPTITRPIARRRLARARSPAERSDSARITGSARSARLSR